MHMLSCGSVVQPPTSFSSFAGQAIASVPLSSRPTELKPTARMTDVSTALEGDLCSAGMRLTERCGTLLTVAQLTADRSLGL